MNDYESHFCLFTIIQMKYQLGQETDDDENLIPLWIIFLVALTLP